MSSRTESVPDTTSSAVSARRVVPLDTEESAFPAEDNHIVQLSAGRPAQDESAECLTVINMAPSEADDSDVRRAA